MAYVGRKAARKTTSRLVCSSGDSRDTALSVTLPLANYGKFNTEASSNLSIAPTSPVRDKQANITHHPPRPDSLPVLGLKTLSLINTDIQRSLRGDNGMEIDISNSGGQEASPLPKIIGPKLSPASQARSEADVDDDFSFLLETGSRIGSLPFLRRNLRQGFELRFSQSESRSGAFPPIHVVLHHFGEDKAHHDERSWRFSQVLRQLTCPFCTLFKPFTTIQRLIRHIEWDHDIYRVDWKLAPGEVSRLTTIMHAPLIYVSRRLLMN
jgi:hypothetical protein